MSSELKIAGPPPPCCVPSKQRAANLDLSKHLSENRERVRSGSIDGMVRLDGGRFLMGTESREAFPADGEGPVREVTVDPIYMDSRPVSNEQFREFIRATGYRTESGALRVVVRFSHAYPNGDCGSAGIGGGMVVQGFRSRLGAS